MEHEKNGRWCFNEDSLKLDGNQFRYAPGIWYIFCAIYENHT